jgi:hypothetical protein
MLHLAVMHIIFKEHNMVSLKKVLGRSLILLGLVLEIKEDFQDQP